jgi:hypothetical protein
VSLAVAPSGSSPAFTYTCFIYVERVIKQCPDAFIAQVMQQLYVLLVVFVSWLMYAWVDSASQASTASPLLTFCTTLPHFFLHSASVAVHEIMRALVAFSCRFPVVPTRAEWA